jgi:hypothetical protein
MLSFASSVKERVVSGAVRALGIFLQGIEHTWLQNHVLNAINDNLNGMPKLSDINAVLEEGRLTINSVKRVLLRALGSKSSKVVWNASAAIAKALARKPQEKDLFCSFETTKALLDTM